MIRYLIDTDTASYFLKRKSPTLHERMRTAIELEEAAISVITRAELRYGQSLMCRDDRRSALVDLFLQEVPTLEWTPAAADLYGRLAAIQKQQGQPIGIMDTLIASHALAENLPLVTHNTRHFERISGLQRLDWVTESTI